LLEPIIARFHAARAAAIVHPSLTGAKILARAFVVACMVITFIPCAMAANKPGKAGCERLRTVKIPNARITSIEFVTSGSLTPAGAFNLRGEQVVLKDLPRFCRVMGTSRPSPDSEIRFEVWLPEKWNGRYQQLGNGGWAGAIFYQRMGPPLTHGFVAAGTYNAVAARLGGDIRDFYRLFLAPAMAHCAGGPGPNAFGGADNPGASYDAEHDLVAAIERWVEEGHAPEHIIATKFEGDDPHGKAVRACPLCVYPAVAKWTGKGSSDDPTNFVCADP
jgi:hypothetical protein